MGAAVEEVLSALLAGKSSPKIPAAQRAMPRVGEPQHLVFGSRVRSIDEKNRTITFVASTETKDRYKDIIRVSGWKLDNYRKNPVFLWAHNAREFPIGKTVEIWTESNPPALVHRVQFADKATYEKADTAFRLYRGGYLNAVSVGFAPLEQPKRILDENGEPTGGLEFTSQELLELSGVNIPANASALARAHRRGVISDAESNALSAESDDELLFGELKRQMALLSKEWHAWLWVLDQLGAEPRLTGAPAKADSQTVGGFLSSLVKES